MRYTDAQLIKGFESCENFDGWPKKGITDIWIRSKADRYNRFDDKVYTFDSRPNGVPKFVMVCTGTSHPGVALKLFRRFNKLGAAIIKSHWINYQSHKHGRHKTDHNSYRQAKEIPHYRDGNGNYKAEEIGQVYMRTPSGGLPWLNVHKAGWFSKWIGWWSAGCLVRNNRRQWNNWIRFMNKNGNPSLTTVVLNEGQF